MSRYYEMQARIVVQAEDGDAAEVLIEGLLDGIWPQNEDAIVLEAAVSVLAELKLERVDRSQVEETTREEELR